MPGSSIGPALASMREALRAKQEEVAKRAGITPAMLSRYERGARTPHWSTLESVLDALGATLHDLARAIDEVEGRVPQRSAATADARWVAAITNHWRKTDDWLAGFAAAVVDPEERGSHDRFAASIEVAASEIARYVLGLLATQLPGDNDDEPSN